MSLLSDILTFNKEFVANQAYLPYQTESKFPEKNVVMVTCMDARLVELSQKSLNLSNGDVKVIKNAGAVISHPFGSVMRSLIVAVYELKADEIIIMGHKDCGMSQVDTTSIAQHMIERGVSEKDLKMLQYAGVNLDSWLNGFEDVFESVAHDVSMVQNHPLLPKDVPVHGLVINPETGALSLVVDGYETLKG
ncbi:beta-class carbonic anhydrase [Streptococcus rifensis]